MKSAEAEQINLFLSMRVEWWVYW